jgi:hypothetical protein
MILHERQSKYHDQISRLHAERLQDLEDSEADLQTLQTELAAAQETVKEKIEPTHAANSANVSCATVSPAPSLSPRSPQGRRRQKPRQSPRPRSSDNVTSGDRIQSSAFVVEEHQVEASHPTPHIA